MTAPTPGPWRSAWRHATRHAYATTLQLATPLYLARQWQRGWGEPGYRQHLAERLGFYRATGAASTGEPVWVHAASPGEVRLALPLIDALRAQRPGVPMVLTHGTPTGRRVGKPLLRAGDHQAWLPYDTPGAVRRFFRRFKPSVGVLVESLPWPVLAHEALRAGVPLVVANVSQAPAHGMLRPRLAGLVPLPLSSVALVLAQTVADAERLRAAGAGRVVVCGDLAADHTPQPQLLARGLDWRQRLTRPVVLLAGSRAEEEAQLLAAWRAAPAPRPLLLVTPRHLRRCDELARMAEAQGLRLVRRTSWGEWPDAEALSHDTDVWLGDEPGESALYYGCADVALLGGSFLPQGGDNPVEAAACGCPLLMGPHTHRHAQTARAAEQAGAAMRVRSLDEAVTTALELAGSMSRNQWVESALYFAQNHRGAAQLMADQVLRQRRCIGCDAAG